MRRALLLVALSAAVGSAVSGQSPAADTLRTLYDQHRWFDLRDAIAGRTVPPFFAGAVAAAFNQMREAETHLTRAVREAPTKEAANEARELLVKLYMWSSRSRDMLRLFDEMLAAAPDRSDVRNVRDGFEPFRRTPDQTARVGRRQPFACAVTAQGVTLPAQINGHNVDLLFDSGFSQTSLSEADARAVGISPLGASMQAGDFSAATETRPAVVERMVLGDSELRNVPLTVFPDAHPMWEGRPRGQQGIIGLPVAVALGGIRWTRAGSCQLGADLSRPVAIAGANLALDGDSPPLTRIELESRRVEVSLDSGAQGGTQLWQRFGAEFPEVIARGSRTTTEVRQIGGRRNEEVVVIADLRFRMGGFDAVLPSARVFSSRDSSSVGYGNLGMDVFAQAAEVSFDFRAMTISLR